MPFQSLPPPILGDRLKLTHLYGGVAVYRPGESLGPRVLPDFEFVLLQEGSATYHVDRDVFPLRAGTAVLVRPGLRETYEWDAKRRSRHAYFHFGVETLPRDWPDIADWPSNLPRPPLFLASLCSEILSRVHLRPGGPSQTPSREECLLVEALLAIYLHPGGTDSPAEPREHPEPVMRTIKWMREVIDEDPGRLVRLPDLALAGGVTPKHLCRIFTATIGHSPMETYRLLRLQLAVALLARSNLRVHEIAQRCGFDDPLYFSRCFGRAYGLSPREARTHMQRGRPPPKSPLSADLMPRLHW